MLRSGQPIDGKANEIFQKIEKHQVISSQDIAVDRIDRKIIWKHLVKAGHNEKISVRASRE